MERASRSSRQRGYTLVELMMIVVIIAVSTVAFAPGFGRAMVDSRVSSVARDLIRIGRRARSDTFGYLRAHLLWIDPIDRRLQLLRAPTNSCTLTDWVAAATDCPATSITGPSGRCVENVFLSDQSSANQPIGLFEETVDNTTWVKNTARALCYAPNGLVYYGAGANLNAATNTTKLTTGNTVNGGFVYVLVSGTDTPTTASRMHRVLFPLGGASARGIR